MSVCNQIAKRSSRLRKNFIFLFCVFCVFGFSAPSSFAAEGQLDPTFANGTGVGYADFSYLSTAVLDQRLTSIAQDSQGRLIGLGYFRRDSAGQDYDCSIFRLMPDGNQYDSSFRAPNGYGPIAIDLGGSISDNCYAVAVQNNGSIFIAGESSTGTNSKTGVIMQLDEAGNRVANFFLAGLFRANVDIPLFAQQVISNSGFIDIAIDGSGRVLALGSIKTAGNLTRTFLVRFLETGALDQNFGIDGLVIVPDNNANFAFSSKLIFDGSAIILAGSRATTAVSSLFAEVIRLQDNGALDVNFGAGLGRVTISTCSYFTAIQLSPDTGMVLGCVSSGGQYGLVKLDAQGALDFGFGNAGFVELRSPTAQQEITSIDSVVVQTDGKIVAAGDLRNNDTTTQNMNGAVDIVIGRFNPDGSRDLSFGYLNGQSDFRFNDPQVNGAEVVNESVSSLFLDQTGRVLLAGRRSLPNVSTGLGNTQVIMRLAGATPDSIFQDGFE